jgi:superfamily II DNA or RNA helicase
LSTLAGTEPTIFLATIASISVAAKTARDEGKDLGDTFAAFGCVLVEEGHYEPAENWSRAIRSLGRRTILLTATPYRNDRKYFKIADWRYRLSHQDAVDQRYLREPEFGVLTRHTNPTAFAGAHREGPRIVPAFR